MDLTRNYRAGSLRAAAVKPVAIALVLCLSSTSVAADQLGDWTPERSAELSYYSSGPVTASRYNDETDSAPHKLASSPDGNWLYTVRFHGDVLKDDNVFEFLLWKTDIVRHELMAGRNIVRPWRILSYRGASSSFQQAPLDAPRFADSGRSLIFIGADVKGVRNVQRLDLASGRIDQLTNHASDVLSFIYSDGRVLFNVHTDAPKPTLAPIAYPMRPVERSTLGASAFARTGGRVSSRKSGADYLWRKTFQVFAVGADGDEIELPALAGTNFGDLTSFGYNIAPGGRVFAAFVQDKSQGAETQGHPGDLLVSDLASGKSRRVTTAPQFNTPKIFWSPDGRHLVVSEVDPASGSGSGGPTAAIFDAATGARFDLPGTETINSREFYLKHVAIAWQSPTSVTVTTKATDDAVPVARTFTLEGSSWRESRQTVDQMPAREKAEDQVEAGADGTLHLPGLSVAFEEGLNTPPVLVASSGKRRVALTMPDPLLERLWWAKAKPFSWQQDGKMVEREGLVRLPRGYTKGTRIPFVMIVETVDNDRFYPDGYVTGAATGAVQSLLARGIGVLQIAKGKGFKAATPAEPQQTLDRVEAVTRALVSSGLADPARLGIAGFSRQGYFVSLSVTHPGQYPFAAAIVDDSFTGTLFSYLSGIGTGNIYGGSFWKNREAWLRYAPDLNADKIRTPVMFTKHHSDNPYDAIEDYDPAVVSQVATYDLAERPIEYLLFPNGDHQLQRPREIIADQQATLDWFCFWLKGELPKDPVFKERWLRLRDQQEKVIAEANANGEHIAALPPLVGQ